MGVRVQKHTKLLFCSPRFLKWQNENNTAQIKTKCKPAFRGEPRTLTREFLKKETEREAGRENEQRRCRGLGVKCLQERSPYSSSQKVRQKSAGKNGEWRDELKRAPRGLPHPSASSGKRGCVWFSPGGLPSAGQINVCPYLGSELDNSPRLWHFWANSNFPPPHEWITSKK